MSLSVIDTNQIDEMLIETLVLHFYDKVRVDPTLGPVFEEALSDRWDAHLQNMMAFWSAVMLKSGRFKGRPVQTHQALSRLHPDHFALWLDLFRTSAREICSPQTAEAFIERAEAIAQSLQRAVFSPA